MERVYHKYQKWEDYQNGMYDAHKGDKELLIHKAWALLRSPSDFKKIIFKVFRDWPIATEGNMTNDGCNKKAWLGQAACCYAHGVPETLTRIAWGRMTEEERMLADRAAQEKIDKWITGHTEKKTGTKQSSFDF